MKITDDFINQSIMNETYFEYGIEFGIFDEDRNISDEWKELFIECFELAKKRIASLNDLIKNLKDQNYPEPRKYLGISDDYCQFATEIGILRVTIKSLLYGLIETSAISNVREIEKWKEQWKRYENDSQNIHYQFFYNKFKLVKTTEDLTGFNVFFRDYLIRLVLNLCEMMNRRLNYTFQYFQEEKAFENELHEAMN